MSSDKNIILKQYNNVDYDILYPKTTISQVVGGLSSSEINQLINDALANYGNCQIWKTSYRGTGGFGGSSPTIINFPAQPMLFFIYQADDDKKMWGSYGDTEVYTHTGNGQLYSHQNTASWSGTRLSFYCTDGAEYQMNYKNNTYYVIALIQKSA